MAQIIKHRRGTLEQLDSATLRQGEILVVTGSSGISAANTGSIALIGTEEGFASPSNKVLTGTSLPDLSSGYGKLVEGMPFYDTTQEKLFLLNKTAAGGHTVVKAEANLGGTNVYSSSAQVAADVTANSQSFDFGDGTLSTIGLSSFAIISGSSIDLTGDAKVDGSITVDTNATVGGDLDVTGQADFAGISGSSIDITGDAKIDGNITLGGNLILGDDPANDSVTFNSDVASDIIPDGDNSRDLGSSTLRYQEIHGVDIFGAINATNGVVSGSGQLTDMTGDITVNSSGVSAISSDVIVNDDVKSDAAIEYTKLDFGGSGIASGSAQVVNYLLDQATDFGTGRVSGDDFGDADGGSTFTGSFEGDGSALTGLNAEIVISGSNGQQTIQSPTTALTYAGGTGVSSTVDNQGVITTSVQDASTSAKGIASFDSDDFSVSSGNVSIAANGVRGANLNADVAGTGMTYALDNTLEVDYGATDDTAVEGSTTATFTGTANEITVSDDSAQALGGGISVQIGLPDDVTIADSLTVNGNVQLGNATTDTVTVAGNLYVQGTTTTVDSTTVQIGDNILELNFGGSETNAGLLVTDATADNTASGSLLWDGTNDHWMGGAQGSEKEFARLDATPTSNTVLKSDASGLLVDSTITDDGTDVSISGDFTIDGLTANSFIFADSNKQLTSAVADEAGEIIQWNGSAFIASNLIDGGSF